MLGNVPFAELITFTRASPAWRFNASGILVQDGNNVPRFDYDPVTLQPLGMLVEEARTNVLLRSGALTTAPWTSAGTGFIGPLTASTDIPAPDGSSGVFKVTAANASSLMLRQTGLSIAAGAAAASIWVYVPAGQPGVSDFQMSVDWNDIDSGPFMASTTFGKWVRLSSVATLTATRSQLDYNLRTAAGTFPVGTVFYLHFAQAEVGTFSSSYIATTTAASTRAADVATVSGGGWLGSGAGTVVCEGQQISDSNVAPRLWQLRSGSDLTQVVALASSSRIVGESFVGGVYQASMNITAYPPTAPFKAAFAWAENNFAFSVNGSAPVIDASGVVPVFGPGSTLWLGRDSGLTRYLNGWIRSLRYYPRRLSNAELQALTA